MTLPREDADFIRWIDDKTVVGFASIRVRVTVGDSTWTTTIFPTKKKEYLLAIKAEIRNKEHIREGDVVNGMIELI